MAYMSQENKKALAPAILAVCKKYGLKASLSVYHHSTLVLTIASGPIDFLTQCNERTVARLTKQDRMCDYAPAKYIQVNEYHLDVWTGLAGEFLREVKPLMMIGNHNNSDIMTDYFDVGWYIDITVGKWDKPYILIEQPTTITELAPVTTTTTAHIEEHTHTTKGFQLFLVVLAERVERDEYSRLLDRAKTLNGWYSHAYGQCPAGFAFKGRPAAETFLADLTGSDAPDAPDAPASFGSSLESSPVLASCSTPEPVVLVLPSTDSASKTQHPFKRQSFDIPVAKKPIVTPSSPDLRPVVLVSPSTLTDRSLESMTAVITVESGMFSILGQSNVGLGYCGVKEGSNEYTWSEALHIIQYIDKLLPSVPKAYRKRVRSTRNQFCYAFGGPDMEDVLAAPEPVVLVSPSTEQPAARSTRRQVAVLKEADQDFEWYPTTVAILDTIRDDIRVTHGSPYSDGPPAVSVLDCGAGDGRALQALANGGNMYAIEKSEPLIASLPEDIYIVGTEFHSCTLIDKKTDVVFCNPPYSEFDHWAVKIIKEANCSTVYLVIPQRWKDSGTIDHAIKLRSARSSVLGSFDFLNAERQARAAVDIVKVDLSCGQSYSRRHEPKVDPFEVWFDEHFAVGLDSAQRGGADKASDPIPKAGTFKDRIAGAVVPGKNLIQVLVELYAEEMAHLIGNYRKLEEVDAALLAEMGVSVSGLREGLKQKIAGRSTYTVLEGNHAT